MAQPVLILMVHSQMKLAQNQQKTILGGKNIILHINPPVK
jgi:hypothetical protein